MPGYVTGSGTLAGEPMLAAVTDAVPVHAVMQDASESASAAGDPATAGTRSSDEGGNPPRVREHDGDLQLW